MPPPQPTAAATANGTVQQSDVVSPELKHFPYSKEDWTAIFRCEPGDCDHELTVLEGRVPAELNGTYYLNGPGHMFMEGVFGNPFDGHGYIRAFKLNGSKNACTLKARFVKTEAYEKESKADRFQYKGFGTVLPGGMLRNMMATTRKNVANTCVVEHGGQVLCLWEGGLPHTLNPHTLETDTKKVYDFGGLLNAHTSLIAHTRYDAKNKRLVCLASEGMMKPVWTFFEVDESNRVVRTVKHTLTRYMYVHDFVVTDRYYIVLESSMTISMKGLVKNVMGLAAMTTMLQFDGSHPSHIILIPRDGVSQPIAVSADVPFFAFHHFNAWDTCDGNVSVISCCYSKFSFGSEFGYQQVTDTLDPERFAHNQSGQKVWIFNIDPINQKCVRVETDIGGDFPRTHPGMDGQPTRYGYIAQNSNPSVGLPFDQVTKIETAFSPDTHTLITTDTHTNTHTHTLKPIDSYSLKNTRQFLGEPLFVPKHPGPRPPSEEVNGSGPDGSVWREDEGWVLAVCYNAEENRSELLVLDATNLSGGPVCKLAAPVMLPMGFHGSFVHDTHTHTQQ